MKITWFTVCDRHDVSVAEMCSP